MQTITTTQWGRQFPGRDIEWPTDATGASWGTSEGRARERDVYEKSVAALGLTVTDTVQFFTREVRTQLGEPEPVNEAEPEPGPDPV